MNNENLKACIKYGVPETFKEQNFVLVNIGVLILSTVMSVCGFTYSSITFISSVIMLVCAFILVFISMVLSFRLNLKKYIQNMAFLSLFGMIIFSLGCFILLERDSIKYSFLFCCIPIIFSVMSVFSLKNNIKKLVYLKFKTRKLNIALITSMTLLGGFLGRTLFDDFSDGAMGLQSIGFILLIIACVFALGSSNFLKLYYIKELEKQGISIE